MNLEVANKEVGVLGWYSNVKSCDLGPELTAVSTYDLGLGLRHTLTCDDC